MDLLEQIRIESAQRKLGEVMTQLTEAQMALRAMREARDGSARGVAIGDMSFALIVALTKLESAQDILALLGGRVAA